MRMLEKCRNSKYDNLLTSRRTDGGKNGSLKLFVRSSACRACMHMYLHAADGKIPVNLVS